MLSMASVEESLQLKHLDSLIEELPFFAHFEINS
jgi:hypothetical protein